MMSYDRLAPSDSSSSKPEDARSFSYEKTYPLQHCSRCKEKYTYTVPEGSRNGPLVWDTMWSTISDHMLVCRNRRRILLSDSPAVLDSNTSPGSPQMTNEPTSSSTSKIPHQASITTEEMSPNAVAKLKTPVRLTRSQTSRRNLQAQQGSLSTNYKQPSASTSVVRSPPSASLSSTTTTLKAARVREKRRRSLIEEGDSSSGDDSDDSNQKQQKKRPKRRMNMEQRKKYLEEHKLSGVVNEYSVTCNSCNGKEITLDQRNRPYYPYNWNKHAQVHERKDLKEEERKNSNLKNMKKKNTKKDTRYK